jgi:hypothetical protein
LRRAQAPFGPLRCLVRKAERANRASLRQCVDAIAALGEALGHPEPVHSSQSSLPHPSAQPVPRHDDSAFAETAHASSDLSPGRSMSDTLAAQVAPKKRAPQLVYVAAVAGLGALGVVLWLTLRAAAISPAAQPTPEPTATLAPTAPPIPTPAPTPSIDVSPTVHDVPAPSAAPTEPSKPKPTAKPAQTVKPKPTATATSSTPAPQPTSPGTGDPMEGRH